MSGLNSLILFTHSGWLIFSGAKTGMSFDAANSGLKSIQSLLPAGNGDPIRIFIYPSVYEGFGIPVLEALACGIPTITSNISSLPEVAGNAAILIDPINIEQLYLSIKNLLSDDILYARLKQQSVEQAKKFSWENSARQTLEAYNSLQ